MQGKRLVAVAAAKRHMVVLSSEGDVYTWGHRVVTPRRVQLAGKQWNTMQTLCCLMSGKYPSQPKLCTQPINAHITKQATTVIKLVTVMQIWAVQCEAACAVQIASG